MTLIIALLVGFCAGRLVWLAIRGSWQSEDFPHRTNFRGRQVPIAAGIVLILALILVEAGRALAGAFGIGAAPELTGVRTAVVVAVLGFGLLGLVDDLLGSSKHRGVAGHVKALSRGQLTTGGAKLFGGVLVAILASGALASGAVGLSLLVDAAVIALAANLINLFDLRPGRAIKVATTGFIVLAAVSLLSSMLVPVALVVGAAAALLIDDLRERLMLGDTGSNALGAALGVGIVVQAGEAGALIALVILLGLNLASEFVSFSKIIDRVAPLRFLDQLGRRGVSPTVDVRDEQPNAEPGSDQPRATATVGGGNDAGHTRSDDSPYGRSQDPAPSRDPLLRGQSRPQGTQHPFRDRISIADSDADSKQERW